MAVVGKLADIPPPKPTSLVYETIHAVVRFWWIALILFGVRLLYKRYSSPLRKYPGPWLASVSRLWKVMATASGYNEKWFINLHQKYGPVVRIAPDELSFASPQAAREILTAGKGFDKTDFYGVFPPPENPDIFTEPREKVHAQKKRVASGPYSMKSMLEQTPVIDEIIQLFFDKIDNIYVNHPNKAFNLGDWLHYFAFDVLGMVAFSRQFGFLETGTDVEGAIKTIDDSQWYNGIVGQIPEFDHLLRRNPIWNYVPFLSTKNALITRYALSEMDKRKPFGSAKARANEKNDLMGMLIKGHEQYPERFGEGDVFAVAHGAMSVS
jgi:Cytochrome P450